MLISINHFFQTIVLLTRGGGGNFHNKGIRLDSFSPGFIYSFRYGIYMNGSVFISPPTVKTEGNIDLQSVCPSVSLSHSFSGLFITMLSHIWMKLGSKLLYEELQVRFDFRHSLTYFFVSYCPLFIILSVTLVFQTFLRYAFTYLDESW